MDIKTIINNQGEVSEICVIKNEDGSFKDYTLKSGEIAVDYLNHALTVTNGVHHPPLKPKWNGTKWVELASEKELQETYPQLPVPLPTLEQRTAATEAAIMALMGGTQ